MKRLLYPYYALGFCLLPLCQFAQQSVYWDTNSTTSGSSGGTTASGTWDGSATNWSTSSDGTLATQAWTPGDHAIFSAGTNATGTYTVNVSGTRDVNEITFEEGDVTLSGGTLDSLATVNTAAGLTSEISGVVSGTQNLEATGPGTLILSGDNTYSGGTTVSGGTLEVGAGGTSGEISGNVTNNSTFAFNRSGDYTFDGVISGSGDFVHKGFILRLTQVQTYNGSTTIESGFLVLQSGSDNGLSADTTVEIQAGATLDIFNRNLTVSGLTGAGSVYSFGGSEGQLTVDVGSGEDQTFSGVLGSSHPDFAFSKAGSGNLTLTGANNYTGGTTVSGGKLIGTTDSIQGDVTNNAALVFDQATDDTFSNVISGTGSLMKSGNGTVTLTGTNTYSGGTTITGGTLQFGTDSFTGNIPGNVTNHGILVFDSPGPDDTYNGLISGSGNFVHKGEVLRFSQVQTYTGSTTIGSGVLVLPSGATQGLSASTTVDVKSGARLDIVDGDLTIAGLSGVGTVNSFDDTGSTGHLTVDVASGQNQTFSGTLGGSSAFIDFAFTKAGPGNLTLTGSNNYSGGTTVSGGTLTGATGSIPGNVTNDAELVIDQSFNGVYSGIISGSGSLTKADTGELTLSGPNTFSGTTSITGGTLTLANANALQNSTLTSAGGLSFGSLTAATLGGLSGAGNLALENVSSAAVALTVGNNDSNTTYSGVLSGTGSLTKSGTGNFTLSGANTYSGGTTVSAGTLTGTTDSIQGNVTNDAAVVFDQAVNGTFSDVISGTGSLTKSGSGTVTLIGTNTYSGSTNVSGGTLEVSSAGPDAVIPGNVSVTNSGILAFNRSDDYTFGNVISGSGNFVHKGNVLRLSQAQTYTGSTTIESGALVLTGSSDEGLSDSTTVDIKAGAILDIARRATTIAGLTGSGTVYSDGSNTDDNPQRLTVNVGSGEDQTFSGTLGVALASRNAFTFTKAGLGNLTLTGANTYTGGTTLSGGTLTGTTTSIQGDVTNDAALVFDQAADDTFSNVISGTGSLTKSGTGKVTLTETYGATGDVTVSGGTLELIQDIPTAGGTIRVDLSGTLIAGGTIARDLQNDADVAARTGETLTLTETVSGSGRFTGDFVFAGTTRPGNSPGLMEFDGDLAFGSSHVLEMELAGLTRGTQYDAFDITGELSADGTLDVSLLDGFQPESGDSFALFNANTIVGTFSAVNLPSLTGPGLSWDTGQLTTTGSLRVVPEPSTFALIMALASALCASRRRPRV